MPEATGPFDILINCAGLARVAPMIEDPKGFGTQMRVMVHSPYEVIRLYAAGMIRRERGRIVNVSSMAGSFGAGLPGPNAHGVVEAALRALTLTLSRQLPPSVKINTMCPGWMRTRMGRDDADEPDVAARHVLRLATLPEGGPTGGFFKGGEPQPWSVRVRARCPGESVEPSPGDIDLTTTGRWHARLQACLRSRVRV